MSTIRPTIFVNGLDDVVPHRTGRRRVPGVRVGLVFEGVEELEAAIKALVEAREEVARNAGKSF